jgi:preprotein translocase subunit Sec63
MSTDYNYDEQGQFFPYFVTTMAALITVPLTYSLLKPSKGKWHHATASGLALTRIFRRTREYRAAHSERLSTATCRSHRYQQEEAEEARAQDQEDDHRGGGLGYHGMDGIPDGGDREDRAQDLGSL